MTRENARKLLPIIQAFAEGKQVQALSDELKKSPGWVTQEAFTFNNSPELYRIKPEPQEFWLVRDCASSKRWLVLEQKPCLTSYFEVKHVREVTE